MENTESQKITGGIPREDPDEDIDEDGDKEEGNECLQKFQPLIDEINKLQDTYNTQLQQVQQPGQPEEISEENIEEEFNRNIEALNDGDERMCADCSRATRVEDMNSLQRGQHISMPGQYSSWYFKFLGKRISAYRHHAIVTDIVSKSCQSAKLTLIHFYKEDEVIKVRKQTQDFSLKCDELYITEYQHQRYDPNTIVQRAESVLDQSEHGELFTSYNLITRNCEHFATWCVIGEQTSLQVQTFSNYMKDILLSVFGSGWEISQLILELIVDSSNEIASIATRTVQDSPVVQVGRNAAHLIYLVIKTVYLIKQYRNEQTICWHCLKEKLLDLWLQFGVFGVTSLITFVILNFALQQPSLGAAIPIAVVLAAVATALTLAVPKIRQSLWSPIQYSKKEIMTFSEIEVGDVVSLTYIGLPHLVVVSEVLLDTNPEQGTIKGIHYSLPSVSKTRVIAEDNFQIDLKSSKVNRVDFNVACTYSPQEVVDRARKRIGEQKWNILSNRSDHLCLWAIKKLDYSESIECSEDNYTKCTKTEKLSSRLVCKADVHLMNEIQPGDAVMFSDVQIEKGNRYQLGRRKRRARILYAHSRS